MADPSSLSTTQAFYDAIAVDYAELFRTELDVKPVDRALLTAFAELARTADLGPVADLGSGPGHVTALLHSLGVDVFGVDLSSEMVAVARRLHPGLRFDQGSMTALDLADGSLGGVVSWYSLIHTPPELLPAVFAEFHRLLVPGGHLLTAFQVGDRPMHVEQPFGHPVSLDFHRLSPDQVEDLLRATGFIVNVRTVREPVSTEKTRQACLLAQKPAIS
ncbi:class I SAM-dependent methyltransferase [Streptoalloteichus hindustanus]|uniref:Methyltransferase domain-containing protein n=1 Tax=Streptoalloteichus hindustanus TaxID=2017 RepID=A0A1M5F6V7_STRHI|nr:class I SAM-dependent methyltransferase [Streptoalloteichus hindustanus]SHF87293.1 Methyltransferase domain-containing protein [Streptoalloteichus hindustanus]